MEEIIKLDLTEREAKSLRGLIAECVQRMEQAHEAMKNDQAEIAQMQAETREVLAREWKAA